MYFSELEMWDRFFGTSILHCAPETKLRKKIDSCNPSLYILADIAPKDDAIMKMDITDIPFDDESFDIVIANHVLEHIPDYLNALHELYRVLKPGGQAILQTPYSKLLSRNFEDVNINTDELRRVFFGQGDHVRVFSMDHLFESIKNVGFEVKVTRHDELFTEKEAYVHGVNRSEHLIRAYKRLKD